MVAHSKWPKHSLDSKYSKCMYTTTSQVIYNNHVLRNSNSTVLTATS